MRKAANLAYEDRNLAGSSTSLAQHHQYSKYGLCNPSSFDMKNFLFERDVSNRLEQETPLPVHFDKTYNNSELSELENYYEHYKTRVSARLTRQLDLTAERGEDTHQRLLAKYKLLKNQEQYFNQPKEFGLSGTSSQILWSSNNCIEHPSFNGNKLGYNEVSQAYLGHSELDRTAYNQRKSAASYSCYSNKNEQVSDSRPNRKTIGFPLQYPDSLYHGRGTPELVAETVLSVYYRNNKTKEISGHSFENCSSPVSSTEESLPLDHVDQIQSSPMNTYQNIDHTCSAHSQHPSSPSQYNTLEVSLTSSEHQNKTPRALKPDSKFIEEFDCVLSSYKNQTCSGQILKSMPGRLSDYSSSSFRKAAVHHFSNTACIPQKHTSESFLNKAIAREKTDHSTITKSGLAEKRHTSYLVSHGKHAPSELSPSYAPETMRGSTTASTQSTLKNELNGQHTDSSDHSPSQCRRIASVKFQVAPKQHFDKWIQCHDETQAIAGIQVDSPNLWNKQETLKLQDDSISQVSTPRISTAENIIKNSYKIYNIPSTVCHRSTISSKEDSINQIVSHQTEAVLPQESFFNAIRQHTTTRLFLFFVCISFIWLLRFLMTPGNHLLVAEDFLT